MKLTYPSYLKLPELLSLQQPNSDPPEHDEMLFIIIHQVYELWFKLLLHELDKLCRDLTAGRLFEAIHTLKRLRTVMKTLVGQLDILETMTPMSFSSFRDKLETASGFQSTQFRELEFVLGNKRREMLAFYEHDEAGHRLLSKRIEQPSALDHFYDYLEGVGVEIPIELREKPADKSSVESPAVQEGLLRLYKESPENAILLELMTDFDEGLQEWRYRHVKMVERTIGNKRGTGGSPGAEFLKRSLFQPVFADLWAIRHRL